MKRFIAIILLLVFAFPGFSQKYISGTIDRDTHWSGDIYINGDVTVERGIILSIEGGSRIFFLPNQDVTHGGTDARRSELIVHGILLARAKSAQNPIIFTSAASKPQMNDWYGIVIKNLYERSVLQNCVVEYAYKGITCYGSAPSITSCEAKFNYHAGISCEVRANPTIENCLIMGNGFAGIHCELASSPIISKCVITQNNYGVIVFSRSDPDLGHYPAEKGQSTGANKIFNNFEYDVYNHSVNTIYAQNNFWNTNKPEEIRFTIYDQLDNPSYGRVIFQPIFLKKTRKFTVPAIAFHPTVQDTISPTRETADTQMVVNLDTLELKKQDSSFARPLQVGAVPDTIVKIQPETVFVYKPPPAKKPAEPAPETPKIQEPILEAFLDSGKREYVRKVAPVYPDIYKRTGTEGSVIIQVIVGRDGRVEDYQVLRSDAPLFTEAAIAALKKFRYKPGTFHGKPVKFKVVEWFRFKRRK